MRLVFCVELCKSFHLASATEFVCPCQVFPWGRRPITGSTPVEQIGGFKEISVYLPDSDLEARQDKMQVIGRLVWSAISKLGRSRQTTSAKHIHQLLN